MYAAATLPLPIFAPSNSGINVEVNVPVAILAASSAAIKLAAIVPLPILEPSRDGIKLVPSVPVVIFEASSAARKFAATVPVAILLPLMSVPSLTLDTMPSPRRPAWCGIRRTTMSSTHKLPAAVAGGPDHAKVILLTPASSTIVQVHDSFVHVSACGSRAAVMMQLPAGMVVPALGPLPRQTLNRGPEASPVQAESRRAQSST